MIPSVARRASTDHLGGVEAQAPAPCAHRRSRWHDHLPQGGLGFGSARMTAVLSQTCNRHAWQRLPMAARPLQDAAEVAQELAPAQAAMPARAPTTRAPGDATMGVADQAPGG